MHKVDWKLPQDAAEFASLFSQKPKMLTDEVQSIVVKLYGKIENLRALIGAENDADAVEGSRKDNAEEVVTLVRQFARSEANQNDYPLTFKAQRRQIRHAYSVVRRRAFARIQAANTVTDASATAQAAE